MRLTTALALLLLASDTPTRPEPAIGYFTNVRDVHTASPAEQNYFVVDQEIWNHSRSDLGDLRLYDEQSLVQYNLAEQGEGIASEEVEAKVLNLGNVSGHTEFDIDTQGLQEYDRIRLRLDAHDFVSTATVSGGDAAGKASRVELQPSTLYDFTKEQLGSNYVLKIAPASFRYLHVKLSPGLLPAQVKGATIFFQHEQHASWTKVGDCSLAQQKQRDTTFSCSASDRVPISRISFDILLSQMNFRRAIKVEDAHGVQIGAGEISRVRFNRAGKLIVDEQLSIPLNTASAQFTVTLVNGENPALEIKGVQPLTAERRVYFDPQGKTTLKLYYGDEKLTSPMYDYARFFHLESAPLEAELGPGAHNPAYRGRPDARPWSERHMAVLWAAMILAIVALGTLALRGLRAVPPNQ